MPKGSFVVPQYIVDANGQPTDEFRILLDRLVNGTESYSINTVLSGVAQAQAGVDGIVNGETLLADVKIDGRGSIPGELDALNSNVGSVATSAGSSGALSASISPQAVYATSTGGSATTNTATVTALGGTGPYSYAWTKKSGDTFTVNVPAGATTDFTGVPGPGEGLSAVYTCTVTDDVSDTTSVDLSVAIFDVS